MWHHLRNNPHTYNRNKTMIIQNNPNAHNRTSICIILYTILSQFMVYKLLRCCSHKPAPTHKHKVFARIISYAAVCVCYRKCIEHNILHITYIERTERFVLIIIFCFCQSFMRTMRLSNAIRCGSVFTDTTDCCCWWARCGHAWLHCAPPPSSFTSNTFWFGTGRCARQICDFIQL